MNYNIISCTVSNKLDNNEMKYLIKSAKKQNFNYNIIGLNSIWSFYKKIYWFRDYLLTKKDNDIIIFTDAYDVFYLENLENIKQIFLSMNVSILFSCEKIYAHQLDDDKLFYETLSSNSKYKYLNSGTLIGFQPSLLKFYNDLIDNLENNKNFVQELSQKNIPRKKLKIPYKPMGIPIYNCDQFIISHYIKNNHHKYNLKLDYETKLFYVCSKDWDNIDKYIDKHMKVVETNNTPCIIHVPFKKEKEHVLIYLFNQKYPNLLMN